MARRGTAAPHDWLDCATDPARWGMDDFFLGQAEEVGVLSAERCLNGPNKH
jgi:hypothetical protein